jgi:hypothetical protein
VAVRIEEIEGIIASRGLDTETDIEKLAPLIAEIDRCRTARINPLRLGTASLSTVIIVIMLPIGLAAAQIFFPLGFGHK